MSSAAMKWARSQNIGSAPLKSVINAIAARADKKGATWAAQATIAQDVGMTERNLRSHLKLLEALSIITRHKRSRGRYGRTSDLIILALHKRFDIAAKGIREARARLAGESSNRKNSTLPTGRRVPGNSKRTTFPLIQGGGLSRLGSEGVEGSRPALAVVNGSWVPGAGDDL
jgi:hypothetical protein